MKKTARKAIITLLTTAAAIVFFTAQTPMGSNIQEVKVSTARNTTLINEFKTGSVNYEIVNLPSFGKKNVIKVNGAECDWNVVSCSLVNYKGKTIVMSFSVDILRTGAEGKLNWQINNEPDYPSIACLENAESGIWHHMSGSKIITISNRQDPFFYLSTWGNNTVNQTYYFDNLSITIRILDYTPATVLKTAGESKNNGTRNYYVSASGSNTGNGTQSRPFLKIAHAMYYVKPGDTVFLASGVYYEIFRIPNGTAGKPITLTAMPNAEVIITPTIKIMPEWKLYKGNIYVADISEYVKDMDTEFPQLFADRDSMVEARFPNMGPSMSIMHDYKREVAQGGTNKNTVVARNNIPSDIIGARVVICPGENGCSWDTASSLVQSVSGKIIKLTKDITSKESFNIDRDPYTPHQGNPFYITGALALLDSPGEYYFEPKTNLLYFYPPWNGSPDTRILTLRGKSDIAIYAENTSFVNIKNITVYGGGIFMKNTKNSVLENVHVNYAEHFYFNGIFESQSLTRDDRMIVTGSNNRIERCEFGPTAGNGIVLAGENNIFTNNIVHDASYIGFPFYGIIVFQSKRLEISNNTIVNSAHSHIRFREIGAIPESEKYRVDYERCIIRNNYFENHCTLNSDGGAFYTWGSDGGGTEIYNNFVVCGDKNDYGAFDKLRFGLYTDNYTANYTIRHNIVIGGTSGLAMNLLSKGVRYNNNTVIGANNGINIFGYPIDNADASTSFFTDNLFVNIKNDIDYYASENGKSASYHGKFVNGTVPAPIRKEGRVQSSGNSRGTVDAQYRPVGSTPDIGAVPRNGTLFSYGADWSIGGR